MGMKALPPKASPGVDPAMLDQRGLVHEGLAAGSALAGPLSSRCRSSPAGSRQTTWGSAASQLEAQEHPLPCGRPLVCSPTAPPRALRLLPHNALHQGLALPWQLLRQLARVRVVVVVDQVSLPVKRLPAYPAWGLSLVGARWWPSSDEHLVKLRT